MLIGLACKLLKINCALGQFDRKTVKSFMVFGKFQEKILLLNGDVLGDSVIEKEELEYQLKEQ